MKKIVMAVCAMLLLAFASNAIACETCAKHKAGQTATEEPAAKKTVYKCPMHPDVTSDKPGKCPKCGMNLKLEEPKDVEK